jgi:hypothetical protein
MVDCFLADDHYEEEIPEYKKNLLKLIETPVYNPNNDQFSNSKS